MKIEFDNHFKKFFQDMTMAFQNNTHNLAELSPEI